MICLVYRALTGTNGKARFAMAATATPTEPKKTVSKSQGHPDIAVMKVPSEF
jgi:hypothetical protein